MKKLLILVMLLLLSTIGFADNTVFTCLDETVSQANVTIYNATSGTILIALSENVSCPFNCTNLTGDCIVNPYTSSSLSQFYFIFPIISFILLYFAFNLKKEDWPIHMFLIAAALLFILFPLGNLANVLPSSVSWLYYLSIIIFFIVMFYYIMKIITRSAEKLGAKA